MEADRAPAPAVAVIAFGTAMTDPEAYRRYARPGIERSAEPGSELLAFAATGSTGRSYNLVLDAVAERDDLEALVLVHERLELTDPDLCAKVRAALSDPGVGAVGDAGATGVASIAWWEGEVSCGPARLRYTEHGGGELPAFGFADPAPAPAEVHSLDGWLLVLPAWTVRNVRFDEALHLGIGYDFDFCRQLRSAGKRLLAADISTVRHRPLDLVDDLDLWVEAHIRVAEKWDGRIPGQEPSAESWELRARRAEAEREAARTVAYSRTSLVEAEVAPLERALEELERSPSWRLTVPLRRLNLWRRERAG